MAATWKNRSSRKRQGLLAAGSAPVHEDPVVVLGSGILGNAGFERSTGRYGTVHLTVLDSIPGEPAPARTVPVPPDDDLAARIVQDLASATPAMRTPPPRQARPPRAAPIPGSSRSTTRRWVRLAAWSPASSTPSVTDDDREFGRRHPELRPPEPGERVVLGSGALFTEKYGEGPLMGCAPPTAARKTGWTAPPSSDARATSSASNSRYPRGSAPGTAAARPVQAARQDTQAGAVRDGAPAGFARRRPLSPSRFDQS